ncbi:hypothetical protein PHMEG_0002587 [Phytophthora megakarya]|uniref:Chromo domain-containing protein n=1 Tax=Phytophthora megakarya TaxID=4795 RepID=A0A225WYP6_9STRA|nr:hypothetical protein PHMEG_0002587 [Phytophthora megakarya]
MSMWSDLPLRSTRPTIGSEVTSLISGAWVGSEIDVGGYTSSRTHQTARSRGAAVTLSGPAILSAVPGASQRQIEGSHCGSGQPTQQGRRIAPDRGWISRLVTPRPDEGRYARKLAHLWHGPFRVAEKINEFSIKLKIAGTEYQIFPVVHVSKLKLVKDFPDRPRMELTVDEYDRLDFDDIPLPEDCWVRDLGAVEYEIERISDVRSGKKMRFGRIYREFLMHWVGYDKPTWVDEADLNCGAILNAFLRERANRNRCKLMQSHAEMSGERVASRIQHLCGFC